MFGWFQKVQEYLWKLAYKSHDVMFCVRKMQYDVHVKLSLADFRKSKNIFENWHTSPMMQCFVYVKCSIV